MITQRTRIVAGLALSLLLTIGCKKEVDPSAIQAVGALQKLHAQAEVGTTFADFQIGLGDARFSVDRFLNSNSAKDYPKLAAGLKSSMDNFITAGDLWNKELSPYSGAILNGRGPCAYALDYCKTYPEFADYRGNIEVFNYRDAVSSFLEIGGNQAMACGEVLKAAR